MISDEIVQTSIRMASAIVKQKRRSDPAEWTVKEIPEWKEFVVFWWNNSIPLIEIPLWDIATRSQNGYLLLSSDRRLPPLLEYAPSGMALSRQIRHFSELALRQAELSYEPSRYVYLTATEIYVELLAGGITYHLNTPNLFVLRSDQNGLSDPGLLNRNPGDVFKRDIVDVMWKSYDLEDLHPGPGPLPLPHDPNPDPDIILEHMRPVKYQQTCDKYPQKLKSCTINLNSPESYCAPNMIVGCVSVGWAMLMSSWKRGSFDGSLIWHDSSTWDIDWPSYGGSINASQSPEVERTIWDLHSSMRTTPNGETDDDWTIAGAQAFEKAGFLAWYFLQAQNQSFEFARNVIASGQPLLWTAHGVWDEGPPAGHAVVAYGSKKADRALLVTLGWGWFFPDKYVNYDQYNQTRCFYCKRRLPTERDSSVA